VETNITKFTEYNIEINIHIITTANIKSELTREKIKINPSMGDNSMFTKERLTPGSLTT
jgi:hypothetical protein